MSGLSWIRHLPPMATKIFFCMTMCGTQRAALFLLWTLLPIPCTQKLYPNTPGSQCYRRGSGQIWIQLEDTCLIGNVCAWKRNSLHVASWANHRIIFQFKDSPWFLSSVLSWKPNNKELASLARSSWLFGKQFYIAPCSEDRSFQTTNISNLSRLYSSILFLSFS